MNIQFNDTEFSRSTNELRQKQEEQLLKIQAPKLGVLYVDLSTVAISTDALRVLPEPAARDAQIAPFKIIHKDLHVAVRSPENEITIEELNELRKKYNVVLYLASERSLQKAWSRYDDLKLTDRAATFVDISPESLLEIARKIKQPEDIRDLFFEAQSLKQGRITRVIEIILGGAISVNASDVHIEPEQDRVRLRFRIDGVLRDVVFFEEQLYKLIVSRLKILSHMKITNVEESQDGRFTIEYDGTAIEVRSSTIPGAYGEGFVMRILNPSGLLVDLVGLGFEKKLLARIENEIQKPNGLILTTGPTGSGKTTTLYSFLKTIHNPEINIVTIEEPIEYHLKGITQTQVDPDKGYTFASGLRGILRQDPDAILVGEIRDRETAEIAVNASLTGHIVFSTLHTNNAAGTIPRMLDLGVNPSVLVNALSLALAQRLVRKLCPSCRVKRNPTEPEMKLMSDILTRAEENGKRLYEYGVDPQGSFQIYEPPAKGTASCLECNGEGYKGRIGIFEAILMDSHIEKALQKGYVSEREIWTASKHQKFFTMAEDGVLKVLAGITSLEELQSVIDIVGYLDIYSETDAPKPIQNRPVTQSLKQQARASVPQLSEEHSEVMSIPLPPSPKHADPESRTMRQEELSALLQYLHTLEDHQRRHPSVGIADKITHARGSLVELMESFHPEELFTQKHNDITPRSVIKNSLDKLKSAEEHQREKPTESIAKELKHVREALAHIQTH